MTASAPSSTAGWPRTPWQGRASRSRPANRRGKRTLARAPQVGSFYGGHVVPGLVRLAKRADALWFKALSAGLTPTFAQADPSPPREGSAATPPRERPGTSGASR